MCTSAFVGIRVDSQIALDHIGCRKAPLKTSFHIAAAPITSDSAAGAMNPASVQPGSVFQSALPVRKSWR